MGWKHKLGTLLLCGAVVVAASQTALATPLTIDSSQSSLSIVIGAYDGDVFVPFSFAQQPGSDTTSLSGLLNVTFGGTNIAFPGGSQIVFDNQPNDMEPGIGGVLPGSAPASYGLTIDLQSLVVGPAAARGLEGDVVGGGQQIIGNSFNASGMSISLAQGLLDVNLTGFTTIVDTIDIAGNSGFNSPTGGIINIIGNQAELTIPLHVEANVPVEVSPGFVLPLVAIFDGQIVATGVVPEPSTWMLASVGLLGLVVARLRRRHG